MENLKIELTSEVKFIAKDEDFQKKDLLALISTANTIEELEKLRQIIEVLK